MALCCLNNGILCISYCHFSLSPPTTQCMCGSGHETTISAMASATPPPVHSYSLMTDCWNLDPGSRPTFSRIIERIQDMTSFRPDRSCDSVSYSIPLPLCIVHMLMFTMHMYIKYTHLWWHWGHAHHIPLMLPRLLKDFRSTIHHDCRC